MFREWGQDWQEAIPSYDWAASGLSKEHHGLLSPLESFLSLQKESKWGEGRRALDFLGDSGQGLYPPRQQVDKCKLRTGPRGYTAAPLSPLRLSASAFFYLILPGTEFFPLQPKIPLFTISLTSLLSLP